MNAPHYPTPASAAPAFKLLVLQNEYLEGSQTHIFCQAGPSATDAVRVDDHECTLREFLAGLVVEADDATEDEQSELRALAEAGDITGFFTLAESVVTAHGEDYPDETTFGEWTLETYDLPAA